MIDIELRNALSKADNTALFIIGNVRKISKDYQRLYKERTGETFKGNWYDAITLNVVREKNIPDIDDCILLIKGLNNYCTDDEADTVLKGYLAKYPDRGVVGCFCDLCKILANDIPFNSYYTSQIIKLEDTINSIINSRDNAQELFLKIPKMIEDGIKELTTNKNNTIKNIDAILDSIKDPEEDKVEKSEQNKVETSTENK